MNYSIGHKHFADCLKIFHNIKKQDVLNHPEKYLGPNYKEVLNLWFYWDSLSIAKRSVYWERFVALGYETHNKASKISSELSKEAIDPRFFRHLCSCEQELIAAHLYIERGIPFTYLPHLITIDSA